MDDAQAGASIFLFLVVTLVAIMFWDNIGRNAFYDLLEWIEPRQDADDLTPLPAPVVPVEAVAPAPVEGPALPPGDRSAVVRALVASGWSVGQIRALLKGDNGAIGLEVEAVRGPERRVVTISGGRGGEVEV